MSVIYKPDPPIRHNQGWHTFKKDTMIWEEILLKQNQEAMNRNTFEGRLLKWTEGEDSYLYVITKCDGKTAHVVNVNGATEFPEWGEESDIQLHQNLHKFIVELYPRK